MPSSRSRRRDEDDYDDDDDRPRRRRRDDDDEEDDRPRRRRRYDDDEDDYEHDRPRRRSRRKSSKSNVGLIVGLVVGALAIVAVIVAVVLLTGGGSANISYAKWKNIRAGATLQSLEKDFGKATRLDRAEWGKIQYASAGEVADPRRSGRGATLADLETFGVRIEAWYHWHRGSEDVYVAEGTDRDGNSALIMKVYTNSNALNDNRRAGGDFNKMVPNYEVQPIN